MTVPWPTRPGLLIAALATAAFAPCCAAGAAAAENRFCLVAVADGAPTAADFGKTWRLTGTAVRIPGIDSLLLLPTNRGGVWSIRPDRRLVPYSGPFPHNYLDHWVVEGWSSRVIAAPWGRGLAAMQPGSGRFETIVEPNIDSVMGLNWRPFVLPRIRITIAVRGKDGTPFIVEPDNSLRPWLTHDQLKQIGGVFSVHDSALLNATIVVARKQLPSSNSGGDLYLVREDGSLRRIGSLGNDYGELHDVPAANAAVFVADRSILTIRRSGADLTVDTLLTVPRRPSHFAVHRSEQFGQLLAYRTQNGFSNQQVWQRLGPDGFEAIPGGDAGVADPKYNSYGRSHDLRVIGKMLIEGRDSLHLYDGTSMTAVPGSERSVLGSYPRVYELPSLGRVLISTRNGLFELTREGALFRPSISLPLDSLPEAKLLDWPRAGVALIVTRDGIFALDADLKANPVTHGDQVRLGPLSVSTGFVEATGEPVLSGRQGLFMAVDRLSDSGKDACPPPQP